VYPLVSQGGIHSAGEGDMIEHNHHSV
jgi:hypothetical protein